MRDILLRLREIRSVVADLGQAVTEAERPHKEAAAAASAAFKPLLKEAEAAEAQLSAEARARFLALDNARREALRAGQVVGRVELPDWATVRMLDAVEVDDDELIPVECRRIDLPAVKRTLQDGKAVPGARLVKVPSFALKGDTNG